MEEGEVNYWVDYIFEFSKEGLLSYLVLSILQMQFYKFNFDIYVFEYGVWMIVMDLVIENVNELLCELKIFYNKVCQEVIISEIFEIVGGVVVFENG